MESVRFNPTQASATANTRAATAFACSRGARQPRHPGYRHWLIRGIGIACMAGMMALSSAALASTLATGASENSAVFSFTDIRGKQVRQSDFRGRWVLVNFWAPWCPLCRVEVPHLNSIENSRDISVVGVAMDYGPDRSNALQMARSMTFVNVLGGNSIEGDNASTQVGPVHFYPTSYLYDPTGRQVARLFGPVTEDRVRKAMQEASSSW